MITRRMIDLAVLITRCMITRYVDSKCSPGCSSKPRATAPRVNM